MNDLYIESEVSILRSIGIRDTTTALISGYTLGKYYYDKSLFTDTLVHSVIKFISKVQKDTVGVGSGTNGEFHKDLKAGTYDIFISYTGFNTLEISNVHFISGEIKELDVILGQGYSINKVRGDKPN